MLNHVKFGVFSQLDKDIYLALCGAADPKTLAYFEMAFLHIHKAVVSGKIDAETVERIIKEPAFAKDYIVTAGLVNRHYDQSDIKTSLQSISDKIDDHADKSAASFKKLIFNASVYCVLPLSLAANIATAVFTDELLEFKHAALRVIKGEPAPLPKGTHFLPSHVPFQKKPVQKAAPKRKPANPTVAEIALTPCY